MLWRYEKKYICQRSTYFISMAKGKLRGSDSNNKVCLWNNLMLMYIYIFF